MRRQSILFASRMFCGVLCIVAFCSQKLCADEAVRLTEDGRVKRDLEFLNQQGTELIYVQLDRPNRLRLMKLNVVNGQSTPLHPDETRSEFEPAVSSDGRYLAFVQNRGNLSLALVVRDLVENKTSELPPGGGFSGVHSPAFSKDNSAVCFSYPEERRQLLFTVDLDCRNRRTVVDSTGINNWPDYSPDGKWLVFSSTRDDDYEIYVSHADGSNARRLTASPGQDIRPRFSPDGRRISFTSNRDGNYEIYCMAVDGGDLKRVTDHPEQDDYAIWHPDGRNLVMISERNGRSDVYSVARP